MNKGLLKAVKEALKNYGYFSFNGVADDSLTADIEDAIKAEEEKE